MKYRVTWTDQYRSAYIIGSCFAHTAIRVIEFEKPRTTHKWSLIIDIENAQLVKGKSKEFLAGFLSAILRPAADLTIEGIPELPLHGKPNLDATPPAA